MYLKAGQRAEASRCLGALVAMAGSDAGAWHEAADLAGALGQDADRTRYLETAFRLQPRPDTGLAAGDALMRAGQPAEAAAMFGAVAERTRDPRALVARGEALLAAHQPGTAAELFRAAQAQGELPEDLQARAYAGLGYARAADGDTPGAVGAWQSALKLRPDPQLSLAVADGLLRAGRTDDAERALAQAGPGPARGGTRSAQRDALAVRRRSPAATPRRRSGRRKRWPTPIRRPPTWRCSPRPGPLPATRPAPPRRACAPPTQPPTTPRRKRRPAMPS